MTFGTSLGGIGIQVRLKLGSRKNQDVLSLHTLLLPPYTDFKDFWTNDMTILGMLSRVRPLFCGLRAFSLISFVQEKPRLSQALDKRFAVREGKGAIRPLILR
jgi:hypothetical protein